jgi:hypothetical protein
MGGRKATFDLNQKKFYQDEKDFSAFRAQA